MNADEELKSIRAAQLELHRQLRQLDERLRQLDERREAERYEVAKPLSRSEKQEKPVPEPLPESDAVKMAAPNVESEPIREKAPVANPSPAFKLPPDPRDEPRESGELEMKLGSYWFVRIGVFMLLTGFVFLANYARERFFNVLPPMGKVGLLYALSGTLLGAGLWLERRREELKNYAGVLSAGGIAAVYYTTYAAHKVEMLRVIESPVVAGVLLLVWAGVLLFVSHRRNSQTLALMSILFAYVTCVIIDRATVFTLFSALVLTGAGVGLMMRSRWIAVSFLSLAGTYLTFAYWRLPMLVDWMHSRPPDSGDFALTYIFLLSYWLLFTFAGLGSARAAMTDRQRCGFCLVNNAAFLLLFSLGMLRHHPDQFGQFLLFAGAAMIGLHAVARRRFADIRPLADSYLVTGVLAMTLGAIMHFSGYSLALTLAAESTVLMLVARQRGIVFLQWMSPLVAILCALFVCNSALQPEVRLLGIFPLSGNIHWLASLGAVVLLLFNGWVTRWVETERIDAVAPAPNYSPKSAVFVVCGLLVALFGVFRHLEGTPYVIALVLSGIASSCALHFLRFRELATLGQVFAVLGAGHFLFLDQSRPFAAGLIVVPAVLYLAFWWRNAATAGFSKADAAFFRDVFSLFGVLALGLWINQWLPSARHWAWLGGLLAIGIFTAGARLRMPAMAFAAMGFHYAAALALLQYLGQMSGWALLVPIFLTGATPSVVFRALSAEERPLKGWLSAVEWIQFVLRAAAVFMTILWVLEYVEADLQALVFGLIAIACVVASMLTGNTGIRISAAVFLLAGIVLWCSDVFGRPPYGWANGLFCLVPLAMQGLLARDKTPSQLTPWLAGATCLMIWRFVSGLVGDHFGGFYLTISWALIAFVLFGIGFLMRERLYRWGGLGILFLSICRLGVDVWQFDPVPRILSFIALGLVLVALGFVYNRWQDAIRKLL